MLTIQITKGETGRWYGTSPDVKGLLVSAFSFDDVCFEIPGAMNELLTALVSEKEKVDTAIECLKKVNFWSKPKRNYQRRTHCRNGHEMTHENTYHNKSSQHYLCRICLRAKQRISDAKRREKKKQNTMQP